MRGTVLDMTNLQRSRQLQVGLAGLGVVGALGAGLGLGLTTHTHSSSNAVGSTSNGGGAQTTSHRSGGHRSTTHRTTHRAKTAPVAPPTSAAPQATTSGS